MDGFPPEAYASWWSFADEAALASRGYWVFFAVEAFPLADLWGGENAAQISCGSFGRVPSQTRETGNEHLSVIVSFFLSVVYL